MNKAELIKVLECMPDDAAIVTERGGRLEAVLEVRHVQVQKRYASLRTDVILFRFD